MNQQNGFVVTVKINLLQLPFSSSSFKESPLTTLRTLLLPFQTLYRGMINTSVEIQDNMLWQVWVNLYMKIMKSNVFILGCHMLG